jgi:nucleoside-diphosphate-sugar epimerase
MVHIGCFRLAVAMAPVYNRTGMGLPRLVITGASGFIGRRLLDGLKERFEIVGLARQSQARCGAPFHENISWFQCDIGDRDSLDMAFRFVQETGGAEYLIHLAAHYDFTGEDHPEYWRTNVEGLRNVLEECRNLSLKRFIFASSLAACQFPDDGSVLTESSPPDGEHVYAVTKRMGEQMLADFDDSVPSCIVRLAAMFSDWCEYAPLYIFVETWLSGAWNSRILGGRGKSAIPYLHVREISPFMRRLIANNDRIEQRQVLIASPSHTLNHRQLFDLVHAFSGDGNKGPILMPVPLAKVGVRVRDVLGRALGNRPFERPWMLTYIDRDLAVDASRSHAFLSWRPRRRLFMERRMAFLIDHRRSDPIEWQQRNRAALKEVHLRANLRVHRLLERHQDVIEDRFLTSLMEGPEAAARFPSYQKVSPQVAEWRFTVALRHIMNSVRTQERGLFIGYCRDFSAKRFQDGFSATEVTGALKLLSRTCLEVVRRDPECDGLDDALYKHLTMTVEFGCDQVIEVFEDLSGEEIDEAPEP